MRIGPHDKLAPGTKVRVNLSSGVVVETRDARDQHGGPIVVHKVRVTHRRISLFGSRYKWVELDSPIERDVNYSFIDAV